MNSKKYKNVIQTVEEFNYSQLRKLKSKIKKIESKKIVSKSIDKSKKNTTCSHCQSKAIVKWGRQSDLQRFKCKDCKRTFNALTGTPLAKLRRKGHWFDYAQCLIEGKSIRKSAKYCGVAKTTSFRWRHRFLKATNKQMLDKLEGVIEINEIIQKKSYKGAKDIPLEILRKKEFVFVLFARDRYGNTINSILNKLNITSLSDFLINKLSKDNLLCTDKKKHFFEFAKREKFQHGFVDLNKGEKIKKDVVHINNVVYYHTELLIWMKRFRGVATKYLENYLSWYRGLEENQMNPSQKLILRRAIS